MSRTFVEIAGCLEDAEDGDDGNVSVVSVCCVDGTDDDMRRWCGIEILLLCSFPELRNIIQSAELVLILSFMTPPIAATGGRFEVFDNDVKNTVQLPLMQLVEITFLLAVISLLPVAVVTLSFNGNGGIFFCLFLMIVIAWLGE